MSGTAAESSAGLYPCTRSAVTLTSTAQEFYFYKLFTQIEILIITTLTNDYQVEINMYFFYLNVVTCLSFFPFYLFLSGYFSSLFMYFHVATCLSVFLTLSVCLSFFLSSLCIFTWLLVFLSFLLIYFPAVTFLSFYPRCILRK